MSRIVKTKTTGPVVEIKFGKARPFCQSKKTYDDGKVVTCGGWALPGLEHCESCAIRRGLIPRPVRKLRDCTKGDAPQDRHRWNDDGDCLNGRCQITINDPGNSLRADADDPSQEDPAMPTAQPKKKATKAAAPKKEKTGRTPTLFRFAASVPKAVFEEKGNRAVVAGELKKLGPASIKDLAAACKKHAEFDTKQDGEKAVGMCLFVWKKAGYVLAARG